MSVAKLSFFVFCIVINMPAFSFPQIRIITSYPEVIEVIGSYPLGPVGSESTSPTVVIPFQKTFSQFGGLTPDNEFTLENQKTLKT